MTARRILHHPEDFDDIMHRLQKLSENEKPRWGKMRAAQMLWHCTSVLEVASGKTVLPETNILFKAIGIITKKEMWIFGNGIPPNMPTFSAVKPTGNCIFEVEKINFANELHHFSAAAKEGRLVAKHPLFGKMSHKDWGFLEYKHIDHHFKQFGI